MLNGSLRWVRRREALNKQAKGGDKRGIEWTDYTWNPIAGCQHGCRWSMPDGSIARCYAETVADGVAGSAYPQGFEHHYWNPQRLEEPLSLKEPSRIFLDSMSDLMGHWVSEEQINAVLDVCRRAYWHTFQLLTKNAPRLEKFDYPSNVWVGVSAPPSFFMGKRLDENQQARMIARQLAALQVAKARGATVRWMSIEPLSFDIAEHLFQDDLDWAVIGAATNGAKVYQPEPQWVRNVCMALAGVPIFYKGNLAGNKAAYPWREEFPVTEKFQQLSLFERAIADGKE